MDDNKKKCFTEKLNKVTSSIIDSYGKTPVTEHINKYSLPSVKNIVKVVNRLFEILYPGYFSKRQITSNNIKCYLGNKLNEIFEILSKEIEKSFIHEEYIKSNIFNENKELKRKAEEICLSLFENIPMLREILSDDVQAAFEGDPAAKSFSEIIFSYPGLKAITLHRISHFLYEHKVPMVPRIISEYSHQITGIDIHPGATIGKHFFIDHATGVVIGETCRIGNNVKVYQGVTLGALSFPKDERGKVIKGLVRHPTIKDNVTIYSGATILGGETVIGTNSVIGGNVWITSSIPDNSYVTTADNQREIEIKSKIRK